MKTPPQFQSDMKVPGKPKGKGKPKAKGKPGKPNPFASAGKCGKR